MRSTFVTLAIAVLVAAGCGDDSDGAGGEASNGGDPQVSQADEVSEKPVKVTSADMEFIGDAIIQEFREEADLFGDVGADYDAECEETGEGKVSCEITVFDNGKEVNSYTKSGTFDPADPRSFNVAGVRRG